MLHKIAVNWDFVLRSSRMNLEGPDRACDKYFVLYSSVVRGHYKVLAAGWRIEYIVDGG